MHAWDQIACSGDKIHIAPILFKNTKKNLVKPWQENEEYKWWTKNQNLQFHTIKKWLYEQILCLPLCQRQTAPTSPLTAAARRCRAPVRVRGNTIKKSSKPCAQGRKKGRRRRGARTKRVHRCSGPPVGAPALAQATTVGPLHSPGLGERKAEKKNDRENVRKCTQAAGPMQALHSPMHTNARTCTPNAPGMQAQVVIMM